MRHSPFPIPNFAQVFHAAVGSVTLTPVTPSKARQSGVRAGPIDQEIRRINSAHEPAVREVASDNELGRDIVADDARRLAAQNRSVRRNERLRHQGRPVKGTAAPDDAGGGDPTEPARGR